MNKVPREVTLERERRAWELRQQLWTHARIAAELGVDESTVSRILSRVATRYAKRHADEIDAIKGTQIAQLETMADEAMHAWERSKRPVRSISRVKKQVLPKGRRGEESGFPVDLTDVTRRSEQSIGNPAFLAEARAALADIRKIVGADAPTKVAPTDPTGTKAYHPGLTLDDLGDLSDAELAAVVADAERAAAGRGGAGRPGGAG